MRTRSDAVGLAYCSLYCGVEQISDVKGPLKTLYDQMHPLADPTKFVTEYLATLNTLITITKNILDQPAEMKFRTLYTKKKLFDR